MSRGHTSCSFDDPRRWFRLIVIALLATIVALVNVVTGGEVAGKSTVELLLKGQRIEGTPLAASSDVVFLLGRDGRLWDFHPDEATEYRKTAGDFRSYSANVMRGQLEAELGEAYEVSGTGHFLVAHPRGQKDYWADRFEDMYRSFVLYFSVRGFRLSQPPFPMVAIVWKTREDFQRYATREGSKAPNTLLGYYALTSNRVTLYDIGGGKNSAANWKLNMATVIHEAAHQSAYNTGIHNRLAPSPRWVAEGIGTMFEAPGVYDSRAYTNQSDRINRDRFMEFKEYRAKRRKPDSLVQLIASDRFFDSDVSAGYSEAWMFTFFLVETMPREYARYLAKTASRPAFTDYPSARRMKDFTDVFGSDFRMLDARFLRFVDGLK
jgi:hypothetical protein